jgi:membrane protein implicated in regulation of membrane protease activity
MRVSGCSSYLALLAILFTAISLVGISGSFRGKVVESEQSVVTPDWIYVQGRNGTVRRVGISHARISYDDSIPRADRRSNPQQSLVAGTEVRVTAEQGKDGEWRASKVEILTLGQTEDSKPSAEAGKS